MVLIAFLMLDSSSCTVLSNLSSLAELPDTEEVSVDEAASALRPGLDLLTFLMPVELVSE